MLRELSYFNPRLYGEASILEDILEGPVYGHVTESIEGDKSPGSLGIRTPSRMGNRHALYHYATAPVALHC